MPGPHLVDAHPQVTAVWDASACVRRAATVDAPAQPHSRQAGAAEKSAAQAPGVPVQDAMHRRWELRAAPSAPPQRALCKPDAARSEERSCVALAPPAPAVWPRWALTAQHFRMPPEPLARESSELAAPLDATAARTACLGLRARRARWWRAVSPGAMEPAGQSPGAVKPQPASLPEEQPQDGSPPPASPVLREDGLEVGP